uniref:SVWC domain-containing protein n=1 Tax=Syphacia muris TaxID=451379 RepID=A0A158R4P7_9BILA
MIILPAVLASFILPGQGPPELAHYLMCVDQCAMNEEVPVPRRKRSPVNCAFKLRCALAPPDQSVQKAFGECEKELKIDPKQRFQNSCNCLKAAGVNINCDLP